MMPTGHYVRKPRKLRKPLPPARDIEQESKPAPPIVPPGGLDTQNIGNIKRGPGRPPSPETLAKREEQRTVAPPMTEDQMRPVTLILITTICQVAKGDTPTSAEIDMVNPPATAVANKYNLGNRWAPELALFGSLLIVVKQARERRMEKEIARLEMRQRDRSETAGPTLLTPHEAVGS